MSSLTADQVALQLSSLPDWVQVGASIQKTYQFVDFASAISFMTHAAFYAQALEHYPTLTNTYNQVAVIIGNPDSQSEMRSRDIQLAKRLDAVFAGQPQPI